VETHKPKPWQGAGEFFREYVIIVVGVLTALGGEQAVEWMHRRAEIAETREALREEIGEDAGIVVLGTVLDRCRLAIYDKYVNWVHGGDRPQSPPTTGVVRLNFSAWQVAKAGALSRMPVNDRLSYSRVYQRLETLESNLERQVDVALSMSQYLDFEQLNSEQTLRLLELNTATRRVIAVKKIVETELLSDVQALGISPEPVPAVRRQAANDVCQAAGMPSH
jgi:hypothetical protein